MPEIPFPPSIYAAGAVSPQQLNTDLYGLPGGGPNGVLFHARRPLTSETVLVSGTAYTQLSAQPVAGAGLEAYTVIDTTALAGPGGDNPGTYSTFTFVNNVPASAGAPNTIGGWWLSWNFPVTGNVTVPPGGVGAGMSLGGNFRDIGTFQYGSTGHDSGPYYLDLISTGGRFDLWQPSFYWLTPSVPVIGASATDTAGQTTRMGFLWQAVAGGGSALAAIPAVTQSWGTVTSAMLNGMGSAFSFLNNPPSLRVAAATGQAVANSTLTVFTFGGSAAALDNYGGWSTGPSAYTAPLPGLYLFAPTVVWGTASSAGARWSGLQVTAGGSTVTHQGPSYLPSLVGPGVSGVGLCATAQCRILALNAGDTVSAAGAQNSGVTVPLYTGYASRLIGAYMTQQAAAGTVLSYTAPVTGFRFQAGALAGTALTAVLNARIGGDVSFLLNRPYFTGYQATAQNGLAQGPGFHQVTIDTLGALPRGGNGDNYGGWSAANHWYVSQAAGWYLVIADLYATPPVSGTLGTLTAGILCSSSGGITPSVNPDWYQQVTYPASGGNTPPGAFAMGLYYLQPGEHVYPQLQVQDWGGTFGTIVATSSTGTIHSQFSCFYVSE